jgi:hypothetical protein
MAARNRVQWSRRRRTVRRLWLVVGASALVAGCTAPSTRVRSDTAPATQQSGPHVSLATSSPTIAAARLVDISVHVTDVTRGFITGWTLDLGDGRIIDHGIPDSQVPCPAQGSNISPAPDAPIDDTQTVTHAFRATGVHRIVATVRTGYCPADWSSATADVTVDVQPGTTPSNGPLAPTIAVGLAQGPPDFPHDDGLLYQDFNAADADGYITRIDVDWGDGAKEVTDFPWAECRDPGARWPESTRKVRHGYRSPASVAFRATVTSTGCDGRDPQQATTAGTATGGTAPPGSG